MTGEGTHHIRQKNRIRDTQHTTVRANTSIQKYTHAFIQYNIGHVAQNRSHPRIYIHARAY